MSWNVEIIFETCILECEDNKKSTIMIFLYCPLSGSIDQFLMQFEILLNKISQMNKQIFIFGDFSLDLMKIQAKQNDSKIREFLELILFQRLLPSCLISTRIDDNGATLIDNIFSNSICFKNSLIFESFCFASIFIRSRLKSPKINICLFICDILFIRISNCIKS